MNHLKVRAICKFEYWMTTYKCSGSRLHLAVLQERRTAKMGHWLELFRHLNQLWFGLMKSCVSR